MPKNKSPKSQEVKTEKPSKPNRFALEEDKEIADEQDGEPIKAKKKKHTGIVAVKHRRLYEKVIEGKAGKDGKSKSLYQIMIDEGYSEAYARSGGIKKKKNWQALIDERLHEDKISNVHSTLIVAKKLDYMLFNSEIEDEDIYELMASVDCTIKKIVHGVQGTHVYFWLPDNRIRKDAIELAYKVLGKMAPEKFEIEQTGIQAMSDAELAETIRKQKARFTKSD